MTTRKSTLFTVTRRWLPFCLLAAAAGCDLETSGDPDSMRSTSSAILQTCTAQNVIGYPYGGTVCGGSVIDNCSPGNLYSCTGGARDKTNNCTLSQTCALACLTGNNSTPVTLNTSTPTASDACFTGAAPLTLSSSSIVGGNTVTMTATLTQPHSPYAVVNLLGMSNLVAPPCNVPVLLQPGVNSVSLTQPTAVVSSATQVPLYTLISYTDAGSGRGRNLVSVPTPLTLEAGGSVAVPPLASFTVTDASGAAISTIVGGSNAFTVGTLSDPAPIGGVSVSVTTSPAGAFTTDGSFTITPGCTSNTTSGFLTATSGATSNLAATVTATTGAGAALTRNVTITPPPLAIQSVTLNPATVTGSGSAVANVVLNRAVNGSDPTATASLRVSEGILSGTQIATFPGCTGSPACIGPVTVAVGAISASATLWTSAVSAQDQVTVSASAPWSKSSASANLTINPGACTPATCTGQGFSCGSASDGCGGTLSCGTCTAPEVCTNNVCAVCTPTTCSAQGKNCGSISDGCGGTLNCGTCTAPQTCGGGGTPNVCSAAPACAAGKSQVTLAVIGRAGTVTSNPTGLSVSTGNTKAACFSNNTRVELEATRSANWSGVTCNGGNTDEDKCRFPLGSSAVSITANLQ